MRMEPSEKVAIGEALWPKEKKKSEEAKKASQAKPGQRIGEGKLPLPIKEKSWIEKRHRKSRSGK